MSKRSRTIEVSPYGRAKHKFIANSYCLELICGVTWPGVNIKHLTSYSERSEQAIGHLIFFLKSDVRWVILDITESGRKL
jgi:hypothetical protein